MIQQLELSYHQTTSRIVLGHGLLAQAAEHLDRYRDARLILVSDEVVAELIAQPLTETLKDAGFNATLVTMPGGEEEKTLATMSHLYEKCIDLGASRDDVIVSVGGGVVGDVAGFLAATYMRGLRLVQIPTTLIAMLTASVGGKTGVNFHGYKNLIGAFLQPEIVITDLDCLATLPQQQLRSGLGELLTVGVLGAPEIFTTLEKDRDADLAPLVAAAVQCKIDIVEQDPFERTGLRAHLNLGHTFGHALERLSDFELPHGLAVGIGLHMAARLAAASGLCDTALPDRIAATLESLDLPIAATNISPEAMIEVMRMDKKSKHGQLRFVLPREIGRVELIEEDQLPAGLLEEVLTELVTREPRSPAC